uniref:Evasin n=1 Tax=Amblyomma triste TaxID=251400 RepID=A0A023G5Q2_AMBTT
MIFRRVMMLAGLFCVLFPAEGKVLSRGDTLGEALQSDEIGMDSAEETTGKDLTGGYTDWRNLSHYEGSMNTSGSVGGNTEWDKLSPEEGGMQTFDSLEESSFPGGKTKWENLPFEEGGSNYIDGQEESGWPEYYEHTYEATTDEYGRRCHERLFARKNINESVPINCLHDCEDYYRGVIKKQYPDQRPCIHIEMEDFIRHQKHVPCLIGVCERGYCRNTRHAFCNPTI